MLVLDIGGSFIKYALADEAGRLIESTVSQTPTNADGSYQDFLKVLSSIISQAKRQQCITEACVSIPGPFDFENGVSMMEHKFRAIYHKSLKPAFEDAELYVSFLHDSTAFLLGVAYDGALPPKTSPCCVMLGTGLGFAFMRDGLVCVNKSRRPALTLWNRPYRDGIAEDYISTRAIQANYGEKLPVKQIAELARVGNENAIHAFQTAGKHLSIILNELIPKLGCDRFVLGGQIAKSADLLGLELPVEWYVTKHLDDVALRGSICYAKYGMTACEQIPGTVFLNSEG